MKYEDEREININELQRQKNIKKKCGDSKKRGHNYEMKLRINCIWTSRPRKRRNLGLKSM